MAMNLKPCPFCGADAAELSDLRDCELCANFDQEDLCPNYEESGDCGNFIVCNVCKGGCGASTGWFINAQEAANAWNRRTRL